MGPTSKRLLATALFFASVTCAFAGTCAGTVASYLASSCDFGPATVQFTSFSNTFGIPDDLVNVFIVNHGTPSNPFFFLDVQPQSGSFNGNGTATVQLQLTLPSAPVGFSYSMSFYATNGCCVVGSVGFSGFPGGTMTESIIATTTNVMFGSGCKLGDSGGCSTEQITSSYGSTWGSNSTTFNSYVSSPSFSFFEFSEPILNDTAPTPTPASAPEPSSGILLSAPLLAIYIMARRRFPRGL
jgi:hypothetical protein